MKVIYEYRCDRGHVVEVMYPMGEAPDELRPLPFGTCGSTLFRQLSRGNFQTFPGSHNAEYR